MASFFKKIQQKISMPPIVCFLYCMAFVLWSIYPLRAETQNLISKIETSYKEYLHRIPVLSFDYSINNNHRQENAHVVLNEKGFYLASKIVFPVQKENIETEIIRYKNDCINVIREQEADYAVFGVLNPTGQDSSPYFENHFSLLIGTVPKGSWNTPISILHFFSDRNNIKILEDKTKETEDICLKKSIDNIEITCFFDPKHDYVLTRCQMTKKPEMVLHEVITFDGKFDDFISVNNIWLPTSYECKCTTTATRPANDGSENRVVYRGESKSYWKLSNFQIKDKLSDNDFKVRSVIPNFTKVFVRDAPQIDYVWLDGKIVPFTDEIVLARIRGHGFIPGVREPRFWFMVAGIIMIILALGLKIKDFFRNRK